jgi:hypothetical protein
MAPGRLLIGASAVAELQALGSSALRRRVAAAIADLAPQPPPRERLTADGLCRQWGRGFRILYRRRGADLIVAALAPDGGA